MACQLAPSSTPRMETMDSAETAERQQKVHGGFMDGFIRTNVNLNQRFTLTDPRPCVTYVWYFTHFCVAKEGPPTSSLLMIMVFVM